MANTYLYKSDTPRPTNATEDSILTEIDTEDRYRFNRYGRWELIPPLSLKSKRIQTLFIPFSDQTGLIFGESSWASVNAEIHSSGCMIYQCRTDSGVPETSAYMILNDFALVELLPKVEIVFSYNSTNNMSASFIGLRDDTVSVLPTSASIVASGESVLGIGYRTTDTTLHVFHNDATGALNIIDTGIARSTNVYMLEIEYSTPTTARLTLFDINMEIVYEVILSSEIPGSGIDIGFLAEVINVDTGVYGINMFDYIRLEKTRPALSATTDF